MYNTTGIHHCCFFFLYIFEFLFYFMVYCCSICDSFQTYLYLNLKFKTELFKKPRDVLVFNTRNLHVAVKSYRTKTQRGAQHNIYYLYILHTIIRIVMWTSLGNEPEQTTQVDILLFLFCFIIGITPLDLKKYLFIYTCRNIISR